MTHLPHFKQNKNILLKKCPHNFLVFNESLPLAKKRHQDEKVDRRAYGQTDGRTDVRTELNSLNLIRWTPIYWTTGPKNKGIKTRPV